MLSARYYYNTQKIPFQGLSLFYYVLYQRDRYRITLNYKSKATDHSYREREKRTGMQREDEMNERYRHRYEMQIKR